MQDFLFEFSGEVVEGEKLGAKFGIATANVFLEKIPDAIERGVYVVECSVNSLRDFSEEKFIQGLMHFGDLKTFGRGFSVEVHLLDFEGNIYGENLEVFGVKFLREIRKFQNADALFSQIGIDVNQGRKYFLRENIRKNWGEISVEKLEDLSAKAVKKISENKRFLAADVILAYAPIVGKELDFVEELMGEFRGKRWFFPKISGEIMEFFEVGDYGDLEKGAFGILEPTVETKNFLSLLQCPGDLQIVCLVPVEGIDMDGNRLGKGGGFYDRFLSKILKGQPRGIAPTFSSLSVVPEFCVVEKVPVNDWDMPVGEVIVV